MSCGCTFSHALLDRLHHTFDKTITLRVTRARRDVVKAVLVCKGCKFLRRERGTVVCHNGLRYSIFAKHLLQNLGGSVRTLHNPVLPVVNLRLFLARILLLGLLVASSQNQNDLRGWFGGLCYAISQEL